MSNPFHSVVVALDFGPSSLRALDLALSIVEGTDARLTVAHAWSVPPLAYASLTVTGDVFEGLQSAAREELDEAMKRVRAKFPKAQSLLREALPVDGILAAVTEAKGDLLVVGTHGRHGVSRVFLGSVAEKLVRLATVPVLVAHGG